MRRSQWIVVEETDVVLRIADVGDHRVCLTVTNDAEHVVKALAPLLRGRRLEYYDSNRRLAELLVADGKFVGFGI